LVEKLNFNWDEVHDVAEQLEHIKSPKLIDEIAALLNQGRFLARGSARQVTLTVTTVSALPGGSIVATIGPPVNWSKSVNFGADSDYDIVGLWEASPETSTFTMMPKGTIIPEGAVAPAGFTLTVRDREFTDNGQQVTITIGVLGDVTVTGSQNGGYS